jgi:hypothetical protein
MKKLIFFFLSFFCFSIKTWKRRYVILNKNELSYYEDMKDIDRPLGKLDLSAGCIVSEEILNDPDKTYVFSVLPTFTKRKYLFVCNSKEERKEWMDVLQQSNDRN